MNVIKYLFVFSLFAFTQSSPTKVKKEIKLAVDDLVFKAIPDYAQDLENLYKRLGFNVEIKRCPLTRCLLLFKQGKISALSLQIGTLNEALENAIRIEVPITEKIKLYPYKLTGKKIENVNEATHIIIAGNQSHIKFLKKYKIKNFIKAKNQNQINRNIDRGRADIFIAPDLVVKAFKNPNKYQISDKRFDENQFFHFIHPSIKEYKKKIEEELLKLKKKHAFKYKFNSLTD